MADFKEGDIVQIKPSELYQYNERVVGKSFTATVVEITGSRYVRLNGKYSDGSACTAEEFRKGDLELVTPAKVEMPKPLKLPKVVTPHTILGQATAMRQLKIAAKQNIAALLVGDTGTGKTTLVKDVADQVKAEYIRFNLTGETTVEEFVGKYTLEGGATKWQDGVLLTAMKKGQWLIVDEIISLAGVLFRIAAQSFRDMREHLVLPSNQNVAGAGHQVSPFFRKIS